MTISRVGEPVDSGPKIPFLRRVKKPNEQWQGVILAQAIFWTITHFDLREHQTFPCYSERDLAERVVDPSACKRCKNEDPIRKRGYLHCWALKTRREEFLEITPTSWNECKSIWPVLPALRGWVLTAVRGNGVTARLAIVLAEPQKGMDMTRFSAEKSPEECLQNTMK